jgi:hypothetical protein
MFLIQTDSPLAFFFVVAISRAQHPKSFHVSFRVAPVLFRVNTQSCLVQDEADEWCNNVQFPLVSEFAKREVSTAYGVLLPEVGVANRSTFGGRRARAVARRASSNSSALAAIHPGAISVISRARIAPHLPHTRPPSSIM